MALISALVGGLAGQAGQLLLKAGQSLLTLFDNRRDIYKMRRVLYLDLLTMFQRVEVIMDFTGLEGPELVDWQEEQLKAFMKFDGEAYLKAHQDVYLQLSERAAAEVLYAAYHKILDDESAVREHWGLTKQLLANAVEANQLQRRYIKKFLGTGATKSC